MRYPCLVVLTARGPARILAESGSQAWRLNPGNAGRLEFCVCVQNRHNGHWGGADQLEEFGITDPETLDWHPMPAVQCGTPAAEARDEELEGFGPLTISEAKAGLALGLGVPERAIEITVRF